MFRDFCGLLAVATVMGMSLIYLINLKSNSALLCRQQLSLSKEGDVV